MAITINRVTGLGGNPPTSIRVEGTATNCEKVRVRTTCSSKDVEVPVVKGQWGATLENSIGCTCGKDDIEVNAQCVLGANTGDTVKFPLLCGDCPNVSLSSSRAGDCVNGKRRVTLTVSVTPGLTDIQALLLDFGDGTASVAITAAGPFSYQHDYPPRASGYTVTVNTILPTDCGAVTHHVDVPDCPLCCSSLTLDAPTVSDCTANASYATFNLNVSMPPGCSVPNSFNWSVTEQISGNQWFRSGGVNLDTQSGWAPIGGGTVGAIDMSNGGSFSVSVVPAGNNSDCPMAQATRSFQVSRRCPRITGPMTASASDGCTFSFSVPVDNPCWQPLSFAWNFGDGATVTTSVNTVPHTYAAGSNSAVTVSVTVTAQGCQGQRSSLQVTLACGIPPPDCPPGQHRDSNGNCVPDQDSNFNFCAGLLVTAIILLIVGGVGVILGVCLRVPWLWIAGAIVGGIGLLLFIAWVAFCSLFTPCGVMRTVQCVLFWIIAVIAPIIVVVAAILGGLPCGLASAAAWGGWGSIYAWLGFVMRRVGCAPTC